MNPLEFSLKYWQARGFEESCNGQRFILLRPVWEGGYAPHPAALLTYFSARDIQTGIDPEDLYVIVNKTTGGYIVLLGYWTKIPPFRNPYKFPAGLRLNEVLCEIRDPGSAVDDIGQNFSIGDMNGDLFFPPPGYPDQDPVELGKKDSVYVDRYTREVVRFGDNWK